MGNLGPMFRLWLHLKIKVLPDYRILKGRKGQDAQSLKNQTWLKNSGFRRVLS
jgi:hypothetical protein